MEEERIYSAPQKFILVLLRLLIGWHLLYEGCTKLIVPGWSSASYLLESKWIFSGFSKWIATHSEILQYVDILNTWGLIVIGTGLILGLFTRIASVAGAVLLLLYYSQNPPLIGLEYSLPSEGSYLIINKTLIESISLIVLAVFPSGSFAGLDFYLLKINFLKIKRNH